ncbi:hypothetical protein HZA45_02910 [Candidatus Peregrinibacteria bacterium]|nr:hypothetical protein [Candidatus Peregrinibacteria bacterium]
MDPKRTLYTDNDLLVVNKLAGELVVAAEKLTAADRGNLPLYDFLHKDNPGLRVVHRLDFGTSGVIVFARKAEVVKKIRDSKFEGWKKCYRMIVHGKLEAKTGTITKALPARTHDVMVEAVTHYRVLAVLGDYSFVETQIDTGRKHQIRQHMAGIHHPLVLDPLYGDPRRDRPFKKKFRYRKFFLHAFSLDFPHPVTGKMIHVEAPLPKAFDEALQKLRSRK